MSLFTPGMYAHENKKTRPTSHKKIKIPTQNKSPNHPCSHCPRKDAKKFQISTKECRWLCPVCLIKFQKKDEIEKPNFVKASSLGGNVVR